MSYEDEDFNDVLGLVSVLFGVLSFGGWMCCVVGSVLGLGAFGLAMVGVLSMIAILTGAIGHLQASEAGHTSALSMVGATMGGVNLLMLGAYCVFSFAAVFAVFFAMFGLIALEEL